MADAPLLARVHVDSWRAAYAGLAPASSVERFTYEAREAAFRASMAENAEEIYLVLEKDRAVGLLGLGAARDTDLEACGAGEIWGLYLLPSYWHRGIGRRVMREGEAILRGRGHQTIVLWVLEQNRRAIQFYQALGYEPDGASHHLDWGVKLKAVRYRKSCSERDS